MKKFIVLLIVLAMTATGFAATSAYNADDGPSVPTAWDTTVSTSTLYGWGQGTFSATGDGGNGYGFPAGNSAYKGAMQMSGSRLYHHNYNHATTPIFDLSQPGTFSTWVSPNWNGTNQGGSAPVGTYNTVLIFGPNEFTGPINFFLFSNGVQTPYQWLLTYDDGTGLQVLENHADHLMTGDWTLGSWHHVMLTWDNTTLTAGVDGYVLYSIPHNPALFSSASTPGGYVYGRGSGGASAATAWDGWADDLIFDVGTTLPTAGGVYPVPAAPGDIPEPATIALLGLGALALLRKRS